MVAVDRNLDAEPAGSFPEQRSWRNTDLVPIYRNCDQLLLLTHDPFFFPLAALLLCARGDGGSARARANQTAMRRDVMQIFVIEQLDAAGNGQRRTITQRAPAHWTGS